MPHLRSLRGRVNFVILVATGCGLVLVLLGVENYSFWVEEEIIDSSYPCGMSDDEMLAEAGLAKDNWIPIPISFATLAALSIAFLGVISLAGIWYTNRIASTLKQISSSANNIASGDFSQRVHAYPGVPSEISQLAEQFNLLAQSLQVMDRDLKFQSATVAHELRTPLTVLQGYLQGLRDKVFKPDNERFDAMLNQMNGIGRLIDDLETLSLSDSGKLNLYVEDTNIHQLAVDTIEFMRLENQDAAISVRTSFSPSETLLHCDADRIRQVFVALMQNALVYAGANAVIEIVIERRGDIPIIHIEDDGPGFNDDALLHGFERFWRGSSSLNADPGGSGLGLAAAKTIMDAHNGRITLENKPQGGARVTLNFT